MLIVAKYFIEIRVDLVSNLNQVNSTRPKCDVWPGLNERELYVSSRKKLYVTRVQKTTSGPAPAGRVGRFEEKGDKIGRKNFNGFEHSEIVKMEDYVCMLIYPFGNDHF